MVEDTNIPVAFEFSGMTLEAIFDIDPELVEALKALWSAGKIEFVGSGYSQSIGPLMPLEVNKRNLALGNETYQRLLGQTPSTALIN